MNTFSKKCKLMGCAFELTIVSNDSIKAKELLEIGVEDIKRIERLLSEFTPDSLTSLINQRSGKSSVKVSPEVFDLIDRCLKISALSKGYFDITVGPLKKLYRFNNKEFEFPSKKHINKTLQKTGYHHIELNKNDQSVFLKRNDMYISFGAIGKGYAADVVKKLWLKHNITSGYINASGDLTAFGINEKDEPWKIGIANPDNQNKILFYVPLENSSVATSGDYEQHFLYQGERYSHNINPKTGLPIRGIKSVSVFSPSAELSDALATAVYAMGKTNGVSFIDQLPQTHVIIIDGDNKVHFSKNLHYETIS